ncbi:MAG: stage V sporulation protein AC [Oscillospiraceae bacterium]|nr:stage V sporulation protein AC [Oscillospiraceae bacterium]
MQITKKDYAELTKKRSPNTKLPKTLTKAFLIGGAICVIGQGFLNLYTRLGFDKIDAGALTSVSLMFIAAVLTGFRIYDKIARHAGAGSIVPITGFANSVVSPALEFKTEGYILGVGAKMFVIAGPVILYGITASVIYGVILYVFGR